MVIFLTLSTLSFFLRSALFMDTWESYSWFNWLIKEMLELPRCVARRLASLLVYCILVKSMGLDFTTFLYFFLPLPSPCDG